MPASRCDHIAVALTSTLLVPLLAAAAPLGPGPSVGPLRVASLVELTIDGAPADSVRVRGAFDEALEPLGLIRVEAAAAGIADAAAAEAGAGHPGADLVVIARFESRTLAKGLRGTSLVRCEAAAEARVLATETGEVLGVITATGPGIDIDGASAARIAAAHAATALAARLVEKADTLVSAPRGLDVTLLDMPGADEVERVRVALARHPAIDAGEVVRADKGEAGLRLKVRGLSAVALAAHIDGSTGLGLAVVGHTVRRVTARFESTRRIRLAVNVRPMQNRTGNAAEDGFMGPITRVVASALGAATGVAVDGEGPFEVRGSLSYSGATDGTVRLTLHAPDGAVIGRAEASGPVKRFSRTVRRAASRLGQAGLAKVMADRGLRQIAGIPLSLPADVAIARAIDEADAWRPGPEAPVEVELTLALPEAPVDALFVQISDGRGRPLAMRRLPARPEGPIVIDLDPPPDTPEVVAAVHLRRADRWSTERRRLYVAARDPAGP